MTLRLFRYLCACTLLLKTGVVVVSAACPTDWFQAGETHQFLYVRGRPRSFRDAQKYCVFVGGYLASIHSSNENTEITNMIQNCDGSDDPWIGLADPKGRKQDLYWIDHSEFDWPKGTDLFYTTNIALNNDPENEKCVRLTKNDGVWKWWDNDCSAKKQFVCRKAQFSATPTCEASDYGLHRREGKYYQFVSRPRSFHRARLACAATGGDLVSIHSEETRIFVEELVKCPMVNEVWIGLNDETNDKAKLRWVDDTPFDYNYISDRIQLSQSDYKCVEMKKDPRDVRVWIWKDENCNTERASICQIAPCSSREPWKTVDGLGYEYRFFARKRNQTAAHSQDCKDGGLLSIHSQKEKEFIEGLICSIVDHVWIGMVDPTNLKAEVTWLDQSPKDFVPNDAEFVLSSNAYKCVQLVFVKSVWMWKDADCGNELSFICKRDKDECAENADICVSKPNTVCVNSIGSYSCDCKPGFQRQGGSTECTDVNECNDNTHKCLDNTVCVNTVGSFSCKCQPWYERSNPNINKCDAGCGALGWRGNFTGLPNLQLRYVVEAKGLTEAQKYCISQGGDIASVHSEDEWRVMQGLICDNSTKLYIGLTTVGKTKTTARWLDGSSVDYVLPSTHYRVDDADEHNNNTHPVMMRKSPSGEDWSWGDYGSGASPFTFICRRGSKDHEVQDVKGAANLKSCDIKNTDFDGYMYMGYEIFSVMADAGMADVRDGGKKKVRMYLDGCFDLVHYGHANACRQAKQLGDHLIVGIHPDHLIAENKGPPVYNEQERYKIARAIKWVDEVYENAPYMNPISLLDSLDADFLVHGDDLSFTADGRDTHEHLRQVGRFKSFKRTSFISTTDLVGRILLMTQTHHGLASQRESSPVTSSNADLQKLQTFQKKNDAPVTANLIQSFSTGRRPEPGDKIVYAPGNYDLLHIGQVNFLEAAAKEGDYLLVGLYHDSVIREKKGLNFPITGLLERALNLLSLRYVSDVLIGAPEYLTSEFLKANKISLVVRGDADISSSMPKNCAADPLEEAKKMGIFKRLESGSSVRTKDIIWRIVTHRSLFERRNEEKLRKEEAIENILKKRMEMSSEIGHL